MTVRTFSQILFLATAFAFATPALAGSDDYAFQPVQAEVTKGDGVTVAVRLVQKATNKPVSDAVIIAKRIDMAPDGMGGMESLLTPVPASEPGVYAFKTDLVMAGRWRLSLAAKIQGEAETIKSEVVFTAKP